MSDYLMQCAASNWCISSVLAVLAWLAQTRLRRPMLAHLLWVLVLVKLVTPPLLCLPVLPPPADAVTATPVLAMPVAAIEMPRIAVIEATSSWLTASNTALLIWLVGSLIVLLWSTVRVVRFHRLLRLASRPAPRALQAVANQLAPSLGLKNVPEVCTTSARVSPMVWWLGGKVRIFVPDEMPGEIGASKMRWILAHELAHVRRGDHFVRWLEWLACVAFWWNPIAWVARRNLRANEEVCCDALVLRSFAGKPHSYANSLLAAVEFLARPGLRPPAMASEINSGGFLERRFRMIVSKTPVAMTPRWLQAVLAVGIAVLMPLGVAYAQNPDVKAVSKRLREAVQAGELTKGQASTMLGALKKAKAKQATTKDLYQRAKQDYTEAQANLKKRLNRAVDTGRLDEAEAASIYKARLLDVKAFAEDKANAQAKKRRITLERAYAEQLEGVARSGRITKEEVQRLRVSRDLLRSGSTKNVRNDEEYQNLEQLRQAELDLHYRAKTRQQAEADAVRKDQARAEMLVVQKQLEASQKLLKETLARDLHNLERQAEQRVKEVQAMNELRAKEMEELMLRMRDMDAARSKQAEGLKRLQLNVYDRAKQSAEKAADSRARLDLRKTDLRSEKLRRQEAELKKALRDAEQQVQAAKKEAHRTGKVVRVDMGVSTAKRKHELERVRLDLEAVRLETEARRRAKTRTQDELNELSLKLKAMTKSGDLTEDEALQKWAAVQQKRAVKAARTKKRRRSGIR